MNKQIKDNRGTELIYTFFLYTFRSKNVCYYIQCRLWSSKHPIYHKDIVSLYTVDTVDSVDTEDTEDTAESVNVH